MTYSYDKEELESLIKIMEDHDLSALRIENDGTKVELERRGLLGGAKGGGIAIPALANRVANLIDDKKASHEEGALEAQATQDDTILIKSPMVGTFYTSPSPDEDPYVKPGQEVLAGQTLGLIEAMKTMTEITTTQSGIVSEILAANGEQVEYDQPLFRIKLTPDSE